MPTRLRGIKSLSDLSAQKDSGDSQHVIQTQLRGTKSLSDLSAMAAESARIDREKQLSESFRSIVERSRQDGDTALDSRNMTEGQILLEVLSQSDWSEKLQEKGLMNEPTLKLMSQKLNEMRMTSPEPSDFNPAARNFNEILDKLEGKDLTALQVESVVFKGGGYYRYNQDSRQYEGRTMVLKDPKEHEQLFDCGESSAVIAKFTAQKIERYNRKHGSNVSGEAKALTTSEVDKLEEGDILHGWTCTTLEYFPLQKTVYYTDQGTEINALDLSTYPPMNKKRHRAEFPSDDYYYNHKDSKHRPTATYNGPGHTFIDKQAWLLSDLNDETGKNDAISTILKENGYRHVSDKKNAKEGDIVVYLQENGNILHTAKVIDTFDGILLESKPDEYGIIIHDIDDDGRKMQKYGKALIYSTDREKGHRLYTAEEWQERQTQGSTPQERDREHTSVRSITPETVEDGKRSSSEFEYEFDPETIKLLIESTEQIKESLGPSRTKQPSDAWQGWAEEIEETAKVKQGQQQEKALDEENSHTLDMTEEWQERQAQGSTPQERDREHTSVRSITPETVEDVSKASDGEQSSSEFAHEFDPETIKLLIESTEQIKESLGPSQTKQPSDAWQRWAEEAKEAAKVKDGLTSEQLSASGKTWVRVAERLEKQDQEQRAADLSDSLKADLEARREKVRQYPTKHLTPELSAMHQQLEASKQDEPTSEQRFAEWRRWADEAEKAAKVKQDQRRWAVGLSPGLRAGWRAWLNKVRQDPTVKRTRQLTPGLVAELHQLEARKQNEQNERARRQPPTD